MVCSGALGYKFNYYDGYYESLCKDYIDYPNPSFKQIKLVITPKLTHLGFNAHFPLRIVL